MQQLLNILLIISITIYTIAITCTIGSFDYFKYFRQFSWKKEIGFLIVVFLIGLTFSSFEHGWRIFVVIGLTIDVIWVIKRKNYMKDIIQSFIFYFGIISIIGTFELVSNLILDMNSFVNTDRVFHIMIVYSLITFLLVMLTYRFIIKDMNYEILDKPSLLLTIVTCGIVLLLVQNHLLRTNPLVTNFLFFLLFLFLGAIAVTIVMHANKETRMLKEQASAEAFQKYIAQLEVSYDNLRTIKHDYINIMASFKLYIDTGNINDLKTYYYSEFSELANQLNQDDFMFERLQKIRIAELKSLILYKLNVASELGIKIGMEVNEVMEKLPVFSRVLCQIIGILIDNGIEACLETSEKILNLAMIVQENKTTFIIENSWIAADIAVGKFFEKNFSTKGTGKNRGLGLYTVNELVQKHDVLELETHVTHDRFLQILEVRTC